MGNNGAISEPGKKPARNLQLCKEPKTQKKEAQKVGRSTAQYNIVASGEGTLC